jgi:hypothetical protein
LDMGSLEMEHLDMGSLEKEHLDMGIWCCNCDTLNLMNKHY